jgi:hypothetical protein
MTNLTDTQIDHLIGARNRITDRRDELIDTRAVAHIDAVLQDVPAGQRNDVDLLLGRRCAKLTTWVDYHLAQGLSNVMTLDELSDSIIAEMEARCAEQASDGPQHEGMWK